MPKESYYQETLRKARESAARDFGHHTMRDGLVRSFRFNGSDVRRELERPDKVYPFNGGAAPVEKANISLTSAYSFTLTWTPGHMTLAGDIGEMVLTHYHAMPTLEEAVRWIDTPDFDYLLEKSDKRRVYNRDETLKAFKAFVYEEVREEVLGRWSSLARGRDEDGKVIWEKYHTGGMIGELRRWRKEKPVWSKMRRAGHTQAEFKEELRLWEQDKPRVLYLEERERGRFDHRVYADNRDRPQDFWDYPDCLDRLVRLYLHFNRHWQGDIKSLLTSEGRWRLWDEVERAMESESDAYAVTYGVFDDHELVAHTYQWRDYYQIAAIQHGCRMIRQQLGLADRRSAA